MLPEKIAMSDVNNRVVAAAMGSENVVKQELHRNVNFFAGVNFGT